MLEEILFQQFGILRSCSTQNISLSSNLCSPIDTEMPLRVSSEVSEESDGDVHL